MIKKYLVYISSTQDDLKAERRELIRIVTEMGAIPITMDAFDISREEDRKIIHKAIEECDYFLNLTAYKGGEAIGKSFALEYEYTHAVKAGVPLLALVISEKARWKDTKKEKKPAAVKALDAFKKKLEDHTCETWTNLGDLRQKALSLLSREMNLNPRRGWVPGTEIVKPSVANELCRLIQENETLRSLIKMEGTDIVKKVQKQIRHTLSVLAVNKISLSFYYSNGENWENSRVFRYLRLFRLLAPELATQKTTVELSHFLGNILNPDLERIVRKEYPTPSNTVKKIMSDFSLLKLVKCTAKLAADAPPVNDEDWELTEFGKETFAAYRIRQMSHLLKSEKNAESGSEKIVESGTEKSSPKGSAKSNETGSAKISGKGSGKNSRKK